MIEFPFNFDRTVLEVFPASIWDNSLIVYHGTSSYYSGQIEKNGFTRGHCPFDPALGRQLVALLRHSEVCSYDPPSGALQMNVAAIIEQYLNNISVGIRLSFSPLSGQAALYATGALKGGQILGQIRSAQQIIARCLDDRGSAKVPIEISAAVSTIEPLFKMADEVMTSPGVVYAVQLPDSLEGIQVDLNIVYSTMDLPATSLVGKVMVPGSETRDSLGASSHHRRISQKLADHKSIRPVLMRREFNNGGF